MTRRAALTILLSAFALCTLEGQTNPNCGGIVAMPPFEVKAKGEVYLQMSFRNHLVFAGLKTLTFRIVPASWKKAGIEIGDEVISIDGRPIHGMGVIDFLKTGTARTKPLGEKPPRGIRTVFEIRSHATNRLWKFEFVQKHPGGIRYGTPDLP